MTVLLTAHDTIITHRQRIKHGFVAYSSIIHPINRKGRKLYTLDGHRPSYRINIIPKEIK